MFPEIKHLAGFYRIIQIPAIVEPLAWHDFASGDWKHQDQMDQLDLPATPSDSLLSLLESIQTTGALGHSIDFK